MQFITAYRLNNLPISCLMILVPLISFNVSLSQDPYELKLRPKPEVYKKFCDSVAAGYNAMKAYDEAIDTLTIYSKNDISLKRFPIANFKFAPGIDEVLEIFYLDYWGDTNLVYLREGKAFKSVIRGKNRQKVFYYYADEHELDSSVATFGGDLIYYESIFSHFIVARKHLQVKINREVLMSRERRRVGW